MKAFLYSGLLIFIIGCNATENKQNDIKVDSIVIKAPSVSAEREQPSKKPVISPLELLLADPTDQQADND